MSTPTTPASACSCRLPWVLAVLAMLVAGAALLPTLRPPPPPAATASVGESSASLKHDLEEVRRVLNDAQSALADRDREIAAANDELRRLREAGAAKAP